jgi:hypothetical protein
MTSSAGTPGSQTAIHKTQGCYTYSRSVWQVHQEYDQLVPAWIGEASVGWKAAGDQLAQLAEELKTQIAQPLDAAWSSPQASALAQARLQRAEATARALASDCLQMAKATDLAATYAQASKQTLPSYTDALLSGAKDLVSGKAPISGGQILGALVTGGPAAGGLVAGGLAAADVAAGGAKEAVQHMTALLDNYSGVLDMLPTSVQSGITPTRGDLNLVTVDPKVGGGHGAGVSVRSVASAPRALVSGAGARRLALGRVLARWVVSARVGPVRRGLGWATRMPLAVPWRGRGWEEACPGSIRPRWDPVPVLPVLPARAAGWGPGWARGRWPLWVWGRAGWVLVVVSDAPA